MKPAREELTRQANRVRDDLLDAVEQLDRYRHDPLGLRGHAGRKLATYAAAGAATITAGAGVAFLWQHRMTRAERLRRDRMHLVRTAWTHPSRLLRGGRMPLVARLLQSITVSFVTTVASMLSKRWVARLFEGHPAALTASRATHERTTPVTAFRVVEPHPPAVPAAPPSSPPSSGTEALAAATPMTATPLAPSPAAAPAESPVTFVPRQRHE